MKVCSKCQTIFDDDSLRFCLQCGGVLNQRQNQTSGGSGKIIAAILSGFVLLALTVGGLGVYYFSRRAERDDNVASNQTNENTDRSAQNSRLELPNNRQTAAVERLDNKNNRIAASNSSGANNSKPVISPQIVASASSVRAADDNNFYFPNFAFDKNPATAWCEGEPGAGENAWLEFDFGREVRLKEIKIMPGYFKNPDVWRKNNRAATVILQYSNATTDDFELADKMETQTIRVGDVLTSSVRIIVADVYKGSADDDDTLISEVSFVTEP